MREDGKKRNFVEDYEVKRATLSQGTNIKNLNYIQHIIVLHSTSPLSSWLLYVFCAAAAMLVLCVCCSMLSL